MSAAQLPIPETNAEPKSDDHIVGPDVGNLDPTDGRNKSEWESDYPKEEIGRASCRERV